MAKISRVPPENWAIFMDALADLLVGLRIKRTKKTYLKLDYYGSVKEIKKACNKMLRVIELLEEQQNEAEKERLLEVKRRYENGLHSENRGTKILDSNDLYRRWDRDRTPDE